MSVKKRIEEALGVKKPEAAAAPVPAEQLVAVLDRDGNRVMMPMSKALEHLNARTWRRLV